MDGIFNDVVGKVVSESIAGACFDSATGNPHAEATAMVISSIAKFSLAEAKESPAKPHAAADMDIDRIGFARPAHG